MKALILILFFTLTTVSNHAQTNRDETLVGFNCGINGSPSKLVLETTKLINSQNYKKINSYLYSKNSEKIFLAILILERLHKLNLYKISEKELEIITKLKYSPIMIWNCIGCLSDFNSINEILEKNLLGSEEWLEKTIPAK